MKKFKLLIIAFAVITFLGICSCQHIAMNDVSISPEEIELAAGATTTTRTIAVSMGIGFAWDVTSTADWITVTNVTESGFSIIVGPYITGAVTDIARQGIVVVTSQRGDFPVIVTQDRYTGYDISLDPALTVFAASGGEQTPSVMGEGTMEVTYEPEGDWLTVALADGVLTVTATSSTSTEPRSGTITITNEYNEAIFEVTQSSASAPEVDSATLQFTSVESTAQTLNITSATAWTASVAETWVHLDVEAGEGDGPIAITVDANSDAERTATITITNGTEPDATVTVTQSAGVSVGVDVAALNFGANETTPKTVNITSEAPWTVSASQPWVSVIATSQSGNGNISVTAAPNTATERTAIITISNGTSPDATITVTQAAAPVAPTVSTPTLNFGANDSAAKIVNITSNAPWTASITQTWITIGSTVGSDSLLVSVAANPGPERTATVTISNGTSPDATITVTQAAAIPPTVDKPTLNFGANDYGMTQDVNITSNAAWTASANQGWVSLNPSSGPGNGQMFVTVLTHNQGPERTAIITISNGTSPDATITVTQAAAAPTVNTPTLNFGANDFDTPQAVDITSNTAWTASANQGWLDLNPSSGPGGDGQMLVTVLTYNQGPERTAIITISNGTSPDATITVTQAAAAVAPTVSTPPLNFGANDVGTFQFVNITSNTAWTASANQGWLSLSASSGTGNGPIAITVDANPGPERTAIITISNGTSPDATVTVTQAAAE